MGIQVCTNRDPGVINGVTPRGQILTQTYLGKLLQKSSSCYIVTVSARAFIFHMKHP